MRRLQNHQLYNLNVGTKHWFYLLKPGITWYWRFNRRTSLIQSQTNAENPSSIPALEQLQQMQEVPCRQGSPLLTLSSLQHQIVWSKKETVARSSRDTKSQFRCGKTLDLKFWGDSSIENQPRIRWRNIKLCKLPQFCHHQHSLLQALIPCFWVFN